MRNYICSNCKKELGLIGRSAGDKELPQLKITTEHAIITIRDGSLECKDCGHENRWQPNRASLAEMLTDRRKREAVLQILISKYREEVAESRV